MIGDHVVTVTPAAGGAAVDISCLVDQVTIQHGRDDTGSQPEASAATLDLSTMGVFTVPPELDVGALVHVTTAIPGLTSVRFHGRVTDVALGWDSVAEDSPDFGIGQVVAVGLMADLARRVVGDAPFPQELDGARVKRVLELAGFVWNPAVSDPGTVQILARDIDSQSALDVASETAANGNGVLWQTRAGEVRYADSEHRRNTPVSLHLDACDVLITPTWSRNLEGLLNDVSIGYGPTPDGGEQPRYVAEDTASKAKWGAYEYTTATQLAALADASALGQMLLVRNSQPVWIMSSLPVEVKNLDGADTQALLGLDMHSLVELTGLPSLGSAPTQASLWVEGWKETLAFGSHEIELSVSGYCRTVPAPRWDDLDAGWTWDAMGTMTWDQATCVGPPTTTGRWADVPASLRWDQVPATTTWNTWT